MSGSVSPPTGSVVLTGYAPSFIQNVVSVPAGSIVFTGYAPSFVIGNTIAVPTGSVVLTGHAPTFINTYSGVSVPTGAIILTGYAPMLNNGGYFTAPSPSGSLGLWRGQCGINWMGLALVGDAFSNVLGLSDFNAFTEYGQVQEFVVATPPLHDDRKRIFVPRFEIEVQAGQGLPDAAAPQMMLEISKDGGMTWQALQRWRSMGTTGEYIQRLRWINLGNSRTWVFRLRCTDPVRRAVIGVYHDAYKGYG
jgi:hypothetical protein